MATHYQILIDEKIFDEFLHFMPDLEENEVYYLSLFGRHKYCNDVSNKKDNQVARFTSSKRDLKEKVIRLQCPIGGYKRDGVAIPQESLALYITLNPRNLIKANKYLLVELAKKISDGDNTFNPLTLAKTAIHHAVDRKLFVSFDYDNIDPAELLPSIKTILPSNGFGVLKTRGGFHLLVTLANAPKTNWYQALASLKGCDVRGSNTLIPVPGCTQGGFAPYLQQLESK